ncbi:hypothetical protein YC2023_093824 [Brassica napus]
MVEEMHAQCDCPQGKVQSGLKRFVAVCMIVLKCCQPLPTAKAAFADGSGETNQVFKPSSSIHLHLNFVAFFSQVSPTPPEYQVLYPELTVWKDGMEQKAKLFSWKFHNYTHMQKICSHVKRTRIRFWSCKKAIEFSHKTIAGRNMELAFLNPKVYPDLSLSPTIPPFPTGTGEEGPGSQTETMLNPLWPELELDRLIPFQTRTGSIVSLKTNKVVGSANRIDQCNFLIDRFKIANKVIDRCNIPIDRLDEHKTKKSVRKKCIGISLKKTLKKKVNDHGYSVSPSSSALCGSDCSCGWVHYVCRVPCA